MSERLSAIETLYGQGQTREALARVREFLIEEPDNLRALNDLGAILQTLGDGPGAVGAFARALEIAPDNRETRGNLALALAASEKWAEAKEHLQKLLAENQNEARLWAWLAKVEQAQGQTKTAVEYLDKALTLDPDQPILQEARDKLRETLDQPAPAAPAPKPSVLMCCQKSLEHFALELCDELEKKALVKRVVADNYGPLEWPIKSAQTVWLEWGSELAIEATSDPMQLKGKKVIVRMHSFEILNRLAAKINFQAVTDVVFVCHYMRRLFERLMPGRLTEHHRVHIIHNGIKLERFPFIPDKGRKKIAVVGKLDAKKDPMLMIQAFTFLRHRHPELELHVAGGPDDNRYYLSLPDFLAKNDLEQCTRFYGQVKDIPGWLADKDFILCTSPIESQGVGLLEAMHRGLRPLIYDFPGAEDLYPRQWLWRNLDELEALVLGGPEPEDCRDFVAEKYSMARQAANFLKVISGREAVVEDRPAASLPGTRSASADEPANA